MDGPPIAYPLDRSSTLAEWLDHPVGHEILVDVLRHSRAGDLSSLTEDPERVRMLGSFPMTRLSTLLGPAMDGDTVDQLLARLEDWVTRWIRVRTRRRRSWRGRTDVPEVEPGHPLPVLVGLLGHERGRVALLVDHLSPGWSR